MRPVTDAGPSLNISEVFYAEPDGRREFGLMTVTIEEDQPGHWIRTTWRDHDSARMVAVKREFLVGDSIESAVLDNYWEWRDSPHGWQSHQVFAGHGGMGWEPDEPMFQDKEPTEGPQ